jgi:predicted MPP superfamily phosphohydrolase
LTKLCIIHLSDLHIHGETDSVIERLKSLPPSAEARLMSCQEIVILVSGDIAFSGLKVEYQAAYTAFSTLANEIQKLTNKLVTWILVPGNHDGTFKNSNQSRLLVIDGILREGDESKLDDSVINAAVEPQAEYFSFSDRLREGSKNLVSKDHLLSVYEHRIAGKVVSFWEFNASWMSKVPEKQGELVFPVSRYSELLRRQTDFRIGILHHPINWYTQQTYHSLRQLLAKNFSLVLTGHEHVQNGHTQRQLGHQRECLFIEGGTLGPHSKSEASEFSVIQFEVKSGDFEMFRFIFNENLARFIEDDANRKSFSVSLTSARDFELTAKATEQLEEMAAPFSHPVRDVLLLSDVYVEPVFAIEGPEEDRPPYGVADVLKELSKSHKILVRADEHHGKTSLVNQLVIRLGQSGEVPLKLSAKEISSGTESRRERAIEEAVAYHYGDAAVPVFKSTDRAKKVAIIDDLDKLGSNPEKYERLLTFIHQHFGKCLLTVNDRFDVAMLGATSISQLFSEYSEFRMRGFSYSMRTELIQRWYNIDQSLDKGQLESKVHEAQNQIDQAVAKALIPSTAFNTLMILQGLEATQKSNPIDVGVAQHYDGMLRRRLTDSGIGLKDLDGTYAYLAHLSWWMRKQGVTEIDRSELDRFNEVFRAEVHSVDTSALVALLLKARIISNVDATYQFRHPSARYFFLAHYIGENQEDQPDVKRVALEACRRLYRKDNSNLIVFLASKTSSRWIIKEVADVLRQLLSTLEPFNASEDSKVLNRWVTQAAKLAIAPAHDPKSRQKQRERDEEAQRLEDSRSDGESADDISQLDLFSQINLVFKTSEILGLIMKSKFGSLSTQLKQELLQELFNGPLRAISFFLSVVNDNPTALIEYLSSKWAEKAPHLNLEQREKIAQRFVYFSLGAYSQALIQRQGEITGSPDLAPYIASLIDGAKQNEDKGQLRDGSSLTYRLLGTACRLSYPGDIPTSEIERLGKELIGNPFAYSILQGLVANHLFMFPVSFSTRQQLARAVDLNLKIQITNEVTNRESKTISDRSFSRRNPKSLLLRMTQSLLARNEEILTKVRDSQSKKKGEKETKK